MPRPSTVPYYRCLYPSFYWLLSSQTVGSGSILVPDYKEHPLLGEPITDDPIRSGPIFEASWTHALHCVSEHRLVACIKFMFWHWFSYTTQLTATTNSSSTDGVTQTIHITLLTASSIYETTFFVTSIWHLRDPCPLQATRNEDSLMCAGIVLRPLNGLKREERTICKILLVPSWLFRPINFVSFCSVIVDLFA